MALAGVGSRRRCETLISAGLVTVNGNRASLGDKADISKDCIEVEGWGVLASEKPSGVYILLNKPAGYVSTVKDERGRRTVMDLVADIPERIFPVGRLDRDTEGLLLFTNDGDLAFKLLHPSRSVDKVYVAVVDVLPDSKGISFLKEGVCLDDGWTAPAKVDILGEKTIQLTIHEGRKRQVRRMLAAVGCKVVHLERIKIGPLAIGNLPRGRHRRLSESELKTLKEL